MSVERTCLKCAFWDQKVFNKNAHNFGLCRIHPPTKDGQDDREWGWPVTYDEDWCGSWVRKEEAK